MIALCLQHHKEADIGVFTDTNLRKLKKAGRQNRIVAGKFDWTRETTLFIAGGMKGTGVNTILKVGRRNIVWFTKSPDGHDRLNFDLYAPSSKLVCSMRDNEWQAISDVDDLAATCAGRSLSVKSVAHNVYLSLNYEVLPRSNFGKFDIGDEEVKRIEEWKGLQSGSLVELLVCKISGRNNWPVETEWTATETRWRGCTVRNGFGIGAENVMRVGVDEEDEFEFDLWEYATRTLALE